MSLAIARRKVTLRRKALWKMEEAIEDAKARGEWLEASKMEKKLKGMKRRYASAMSELQIKESGWRSRAGR